MAGPTRRPAWLAEESDPAGCGFKRVVHAAYPDGPHHLPQSGADLLLNVHVMSYVTQVLHQTHAFSLGPTALWPPL